MLTILWWVLGSIGVLLLLLLLWFGYQVLKFRRLQPIIFEYLALQDVETALKYIGDHPQLLTSDAETFISVLLSRAWDRGDAELSISSAIRLSLLVRYREHGIEAARRMAANNLQVWLNAASGPSWQRALELPGHLVVEKEIRISPEEMSEELVEAMSRIIDLLRPFAANEETIALQDEILRGMRQALRHKKEKSVEKRGNAD